MDFLNLLRKTQKNALKELNKTPIKILSMPKLSKISSKISKKTGRPPGTISYIGTERKEPVKIQIIDFTKSEIMETEIKDVSELIKFKNKKSVTWINVIGIHETEIITEIGNTFQLHPLLLEDICNTHQRPKMEEFDDELFFTVKMLSFDAEKNHIKEEQISLILGSGFVISFQEKEGDVFDSIRNRARNNKSRLRKLGNDYLAYSLIDVIIDHYFVVLEKIGEQIENLESTLIENQDPKIINIIYGLKRELLLLRKSVWPMREVISSFQRAETKLVRHETNMFIRDLYDHTIQVIDTIETFRDLLSGMIDLHISTSSNKMNEIMKVLTGIATIFIPLTFISGIYGMNFEYMPELKLWWFYPMVLISMVLLGILMYFYFKKRAFL